MLYTCPARKTKRELTHKNQLAHDLCQFPGRSESRQQPAGCPASFDFTVFPIPAGRAKTNVRSATEREYKVNRVFYGDTFRRGWKPLSMASCVSECCGVMVGAASSADQGRTWKFITNNSEAIGGGLRRQLVTLTVPGQRRCENWCTELTSKFVNTTAFSVKEIDAATGGIEPGR